MDKQDVFKNLTVVKRSGQRVPFNKIKIVVAIRSAYNQLGIENYETEAHEVLNKVIDFIEKNYEGRKTITVEDIQNITQDILKQKNEKVYEAFSKYRQKRALSREVFEEKQQHKFINSIEKIINEINTSEGNLDHLFNSLGKTISGDYAKSYLIDNKYIRSHNENKIYIHDLDYYLYGFTSYANMDLSNLEKNSIQSFTDQLIKTVKNASKEQCNYQTICSFDYLYEEIILQTYQKHLKNNLERNLSFLSAGEYINKKSLYKEIDNLDTIVYPKDFEKYILNEKVSKAFKNAYEEAFNYIEKQLDYSIEKIFENLDFKVEISLGTNNSDTGCFIKERYIKILEEKNPKNIHTVFKIEDDICFVSKIKNQNINILFQKSNEINDQESFLNGLIIYNNIYSESESLGRMVLSTTSLNLGRIGLRNNKENFYEELDEMLEFIKNQILQRYNYQASQSSEKFMYLFKDNIIKDSGKLEKDQRIRKVIKHGVLNISLVGILECVCGLKNKKIDNLNKSDFKMILEIIDYINQKLKIFEKEEKVNFVLTEEDNIDVLSKIYSTDKIIYKKNLQGSTRYRKIFETIENIEIEESQKLNFYGKLQNQIGMCTSTTTENLEKYRENNIRFVRITNDN